MKTFRYSNKTSLHVPYVPHPKIHIITVAIIVHDFRVLYLRDFPVDFFTSLLAGRRVILTIPLEFSGNCRGVVESTGGSWLLLLFAVC